MDLNRLDERIKAMESHLDIVIYLDKSPQHLVPVQGIPTEAKIEEAKDRHRWSRKSVVHMLNAIIFEIAIKILWELDNEKKPKNTHDIFKLYEGLKPNSQSDLKSLYDEKVKLLAGTEGNQGGQQVRFGDLVQFQSWEDALHANRDVMVNFKYDGIYKGKSSAMGSAVWNNETLWMMPPIEWSQFAESICLYVKDEVEKTKRGCRLK